MAHPSVVIQQAIFQFFDQWSQGLQPNLDIKTEANGSIVVMSKVTVQNSSNPYCQCYGHQSGRDSRCRRKAARAHYQEPDTAIDTIGVDNNLDETVV